MKLGLECRLFLVFALVWAKSSNPYTRLNSHISVMETRGNRIDYLTCLLSLAHEGSPSRKVRPLRVFAHISMAFISCRSRLTGLGPEVAADRLLETSYPVPGTENLTKPGSSVLPALFRPSCSPGLESHRVAFLNPVLGGDTEKSRRISYHLPPPSPCRSFVQSNFEPFSH